MFNSYKILDRIGYGSNFNNIYIKGNLNINGTTTIVDTINTTTTFSSLNISDISIFNNDITLNSTLNVSGLTTLSNDTTINGILNVSGNSNFNKPYLFPIFDSRSVYTTKLKRGEIRAKFSRY